MYSIKIFAKIPLPDFYSFNRVPKNWTEAQDVQLGTSKADKKLNLGSHGFYSMPITREKSENVAF